MSADFPDRVRCVQIARQFFELEEPTSSELWAMMLAIAVELEFRHPEFRPLTVRADELASRGYRWSQGGNLLEAAPVVAAWSMEDLDDA